MSSEVLVLDTQPLERGLYRFDYGTLATPMSHSTGQTVANYLGGERRSEGVRHLSSVATLYKPL